MATTVAPGLDGVVAAQTRLSEVDGERGELTIAGFPVELLASRATFEETLFLLWNDRLPAPVELSEFRDEWSRQRALPPATLALLRAAAGAGLTHIEALRMGVDSLGLVAAGSPREDAALVLARIPTLVATYWRLRREEAPLVPRQDLGYAANFLYLLTGDTPAPGRVRALETYFNTVVDHGLNASTFTARVIISTQSDMVSALVGAIGALKGPLHGGAPGPALAMVFEIGSLKRAEPYLREKLERGERLMGFGHRIYKVRDPRAEVLSQAAARLYQSDGDAELYRLARHVEETAVRLLAEYKPGRRLQTNVEFYTALLLHGLGLETELFTPIFAMSRAGGWAAHCFEQLSVGRIIRPQSEYVGLRHREWVPLAER